MSVAVLIGACMTSYGLGALSVVAALISAWFLGGKVFLGGRMR